MPTAAISVAITMNATNEAGQLGALGRALLDLLPDDGVCRRPARSGHRLLGQSRRS